MAASHSEGIQVGKFCALRAEKCSPCNARYQKNCDPPPRGWAVYYFIQGRKVEVKKKHEAHHLLCVACVTEFLAKKEEILEIVEQTEWCINKKPNMFAMPLWGHTIKYYCNIVQGGVLLAQAQGPKFENIPQHDYNHNSVGGYKSEVDTDMEKLADQIEKKAEESHEAAVGELKHKLQTLSNTYRTTLQGRGIRLGGTHVAWQLGSAQPTSDWYLPFSMASDGAAEPRTFPAQGFDGKVVRKIARLVAAATRWGRV